MSTCPYQNGEQEGEEEGEEAWDDGGLLRFGGPSLRKSHQEAPPTAGQNQRHVRVGPLLHRAGTVTRSGDPRGGLLWCSIECPQAILPLRTTLSISRIKAFRQHILIFAQLYAEELKLVVSEYTLLCISFLYTIVILLLLCHIIFICKSAGQLSDEGKMSNI